MRHFVDGLSAGLAGRQAGRQVDGLVGGQAGRQGGWRADRRTGISD